MIEVENDEQLSQLKMKLAKDKLLVYGMTEKEIKIAPSEDGVQKARMILRSRGAVGSWSRRPSWSENYYDSKDELMVITPLDHLWVQGNVSELDADKVEVGQTLKVIFPFSIAEREIVAKIDYIDKAIDPETRSAKFRTTISNPSGMGQGPRVREGAGADSTQAGTHGHSPHLHGLGRSHRLRLYPQAREGATSSSDVPS